MEKKIAVIFPGIGYHVDKPLLYYSRKLVRESGFETTEVLYKNFPGRIRGNPARMKMAFETGLDQAESLLSDIDFNQYDKLLFLSKSIGTTIAAAYAARHRLEAAHIMYTPLAETFTAAAAERPPAEICTNMEANCHPEETCTNIDADRDTGECDGDERLTGGAAIAFHGTADPWAKTDILQQLCRERGIPLYISRGANHSLETGDAQEDLIILQKVMEQTRSFVNNFCDL